MKIKPKNAQPKKEVLYDVGLSSEAKGVYSYLCYRAKESGRDFCIENIQKDFPKDSQIRQSLNELVKKKVMVKTGDDEYTLVTSKTQKPTAEDYKKRIEDFEAKVYEIKGYPRGMLKEFIEFRTEQSTTGIPRFSAQKFFDLSRRLKTRERKAKDNIKPVYTPNPLHSKNKTYGFTSLIRGDQKTQEREDDGSGDLY